MATGVTDQGFVPKIVTDLVSDIEAAELSIIDPALDTSPEEPIGQINGIFAGKLAELWELGAVAYNAFNRNAAEGPLLDNIGALTGTPRKGAKPSYVYCTCTLSSGTYAVGSLVANVTGQPTVQFANAVSVTSSGGSVTGILFIALVDGPLVANAGTLTTITNPVSGWTAITNPNDAVVGTNVEADTAYRLRQMNELAASGACTIDSIRADVLNVAGVQQCFVFENTGIYVDSLLLPPKSFEVCVYDGITPQASDSAIGQVIWDDKPAGIQDFGVIPVTVKDSQNNDRVVLFTRATVKQVWMTWTLTLLPGYSDVNIAPQVKAAAKALGDKVLTLGEEVVALLFRSAAFQVPGVLDVPDFRLGFGASPSGTSNLVLAPREIAVLDTSRMVVDGI